MKKNEQVEKKEEPQVKKIAPKPIRKQVKKKSKATPTEKKEQTYLTTAIRTRFSTRYRARAGFETPRKTVQKKLPFGLISPMASPRFKELPSARKTMDISVTSKMSPKKQKSSPTKNVQAAQSAL